MKIDIIIPARWGSSRFEGKPLAQLGGHSVIERVYRRALSAGTGNVAVATDDSRIFDAVEAFGGTALMTSPHHTNGTQRVQEAARLCGDADVIINVQGDEPFIAPEQIKALAACFEDPDVDIASLARPFDPANGFEALSDPNLVKVVMDNNMNALYFSRSVIPFVRSANPADRFEKASYHTHVGIYAYRRHVLEAITSLPPTKLEQAESLEQLRWLGAGYTIRMALTQTPTIGIDTAADLAAAEEYLAAHPECDI